MTYSPNIPIAGQSPASQTTQLQTNFTQFQNIFSSTSGGVIYNHTAINQFKQGQHQALLMESQSADPAIVSNEVVIYNKSAAQKSGSKQQIFAKIPKYLPTIIDHNIVGSTPMQLTFNQVNTTGPTQYQSFIAGGYVVYFGTTTGASLTITLSPQPTKILSVIAYATNVSPPLPYEVSVASVNNATGKIVLNALVAATITWMAICQQ